MRREMTAQVGSDGVLTLTLDPEDANKTVRIVVETVEKAAAKSQEEWKRWVESVAGSITDPTFIRHPQGEYEQRDEFP